MEGAMWRLILVLLMMMFCSKALAKERTEAEHGSMVELGAIVQTNNHLIPSIGLYGVIMRSDHFEFHTSVWSNITNLGGGIGFGTLHRVNSRLWLGWEVSTEMEKHEKTLFLGIGPVCEMPIVPHRLNSYIAMPMGWGRSSHHDGFEWAAVAGLSVAIWH